MTNNANRTQYGRLIDVHQLSPLTGKTLCMKELVRLIRIPFIFKTINTASRYEKV